MKNNKERVETPARFSLKVVYLRQTLQSLRY